jgi:CTP:molybdopterin cytidylyltransferase MocA
MGRPKALLPIGDSGDTFLTHILKTLRDGGIERLVVVVGGYRDAVRATLADDESLTVVDNPDFEQGQLTSLLVGLAAAEALGDVDAVMMTLVDLPLISPATVKAVLAACRQSPRAPLVRPRRGTHHGHPVIFRRSLFGELRAADPTKGARPVVQAHRAEELSVDVTDEGAFADVDTQEDYERLIRPTLRRVPEGPV